MLESLVIHEVEKISKQGLWPNLTWHGEGFLEGLSIVLNIHSDYRFETETSRIIISNVKNRTANFLTYWIWNEVHLQVGTIKLVHDMPLPSNCNTFINYLCISLEATLRYVSAHFSKIRSYKKKNISYGLSDTDVIAYNSGQASDYRLSYHTQFVTAFKPNLLLSFSFLHFVLYLSFKSTYKPMLPDESHFMSLSICLLAAGMALLVHWLATGWTVRGSNSGRERNSMCHRDGPRGPPSLLFNGYQFFPRGKEAWAWCRPHTSF
jgi:hypothetical protein